MPTYEYRCRDCGEDLEVQQSFTDDPLTECPACGGSLRKIFGNVGIAFKGSGFYKNDSRPSGGSTSTSKSTGPASTSSGTDGSGGSGSSGSSEGGGSATSTATSTATPDPGGSAGTGASGNS